MDEDPGRPWWEGVEVSTEKAEPWRERRLSRVVGRLSVYAPSGYHFAGLIRLHDQKGGLIADWAAEPSSTAMTLLQNAWTAEGEPSIDHRWPGAGEGGE